MAWQHYYAGLYGTVLHEAGKFKIDWKNPAPGQPQFTYIALSKGKKEASERAIRYADEGLES